MVPVILAHRGASATHPENTIRSFRAAKRAGADGVELDIRVSSDDQIVVVHDETIGGRLVGQMARAEFDDDVPDLAAALGSCGEMMVNIEVKNQRGEACYRLPEPLAELVVAEIRSAAGGPILLSSFDLATVDALRRKGSYPTGWLIEPPMDAGEALQRVIAHGHQALHPHHTQVDAALVAAARRSGVKLFVWTVDDPRRQRELADLGVDGIITNRPAEALAVLSQARSAAKAEDAGRS